MANARHNNLNLLKQRTIYIYKNFYPAIKPAQRVIFHQKFKENLKKSNSHSKLSLQRRLLQSIFTSKKD